MDTDDESPQLSASTLAALQEFYEENAWHDVTSKNTKITENWQLSQFWYDDTTIEYLTELLLKTVGEDGKVALISCPSLYPSISKRLQQVDLFEYDKRFQIYGDSFIFYDYNNPLNIPSSKAKSYDAVIADPPFLSEECLSKTAETIKYLTKNKIILCTGTTMADLALKYLNVKKIDFVPKHQNNLANEFSCYTNI